MLVDFWGRGCGPCAAMGPILTKLEERHPEVGFAKLDVGAHPDIAWAFDVLSVPTFILFDGGMPTERIVGAVPAQRLEQLLAGESA